MRGSDFPSFCGLLPVEFGERLFAMLRGNLAPLAAVNRPSFVLVSLAESSADRKAKMLQELTPIMPTLKASANKGSVLLHSVSPLEDQWC